MAIPKKCIKGFVIRRYKNGKPVVNHLAARCFLSRLAAERELARMSMVFPLGDFRLEPVEVSETRCWLSSEPQSHT